MMHSADRKNRQHNNDVELTRILLDQFGKRGTLDDLRARLLDLEVAEELPEAAALAIRACLELLDDNVDDAEALLEGALECAANAEEKGLVSFVRGLAAMQRLRNRQALRHVLTGLWLNPDPQLWPLFLVIAHDCNREDVVEATLLGLAKSNFFDSAELREQLLTNPSLECIRGCHTYVFEIEPRLRRGSIN